MVGSSRIVPSGGIVHPLGNAESPPEEERRLRRRILETALDRLTQPAVR
jgi:glycine reductase